MMARCELVRRSGSWVTTAAVRRRSLACLGLSRHLPQRRETVWAGARGRSAMSRCGRCRQNCRPTASSPPMCTGCLTVLKRSQPRCGGWFTRDTTPTGSVWRHHMQPNAPSNSTTHCSAGCCGFPVISSSMSRETISTIDATPTGASPHDTLYACSTPAHRRGRRRGRSHGGAAAAGAALEPSRVSGVRRRVAGIGVATTAAASTARTGLRIALVIGGVPSGRAGWPGRRRRRPRPGWGRAGAVSR
jgi:hypothetical protein